VFDLRNQTILDEIYIMSYINLVDRFSVVGCFGFSKCFEESNHFR
jgi:hypothetical protein